MNHFPIQLGLPRLLSLPGTVIFQITHPPPYRSFLFDPRAAILLYFIRLMFILQVYIETYHCAICKFILFTAYRGTGACGTPSLGKFPPLDLRLHKLLLASRCLLANIKCLLGKGLNWVLQRCCRKGGPVLPQVGAQALLGLYQRLSVQMKGNVHLSTACEGIFVFRPFSAPFQGLKWGESLF
jgi:hypothetical protein